MRFYNLLIVLLLAFIFSYNNSYSVMGTVVLVKGVIEDEDSGGPVKTKITFIDGKGKKTSSNSNSIDGSFQLILNSGNNYNVFLEDFILVSNNPEINIQEYDKYTEVVHNFKARKIDAGLEIMKFKAFEPNDSTFTDSLFTPFKQLRDFLRNNMKVHVAITVSSEDSWLKKKTIKVQIPSKKKRKKYKYVKLTTENRLSSLVEARIAEVRSYLNELRIRDTKFEIIPDVKIIKPKKKKRKRRSKKKSPEPPEPPIPNVTVTVSKIMKL